MNRIAQKIIVQRLGQLSPIDVQKAIELSTPRLTDWSKIKEVVEYCSNHGYPLNGENKPLIMTVIYFLFAEYKLHYNIKLPIGIRDHISDAFGFVSSETVNYYSELCPVYAKAKNWREKYEALANGYLEQIQQVTA